jgi:hypothetical protein
VLISFASNTINAQVLQKDTLKKVSVDSLNTGQEGETIESKITYGAEDSVVYLASIAKVLLYGKSHVEYETMDLKAEYIEIDYEKNIVTAFGKKDSLGKNFGTPVFKDGQQTMEADKIMYNLKTKKGKIFNALTKQGELLVIGNEIKKDSTNIIYMKDMRCIPCKEQDARTVFRATKAKIIPDDKIVTGPMYLEIGGVPTPFALPFGFFPNTKKQHNGILMPQPGNSPTQGFFLKDGGFYWGINDKTDMVIKGDVYSNGSYALRTTNDYNVLYKASGAVNLGFNQINLGDKDILKNTGSLPGFSKQQAYSIGWLHTQDNKNNPTIRFSANVNYVSNQSINRFNSLNSGQFLNNTFQSNINFTKTFKLSSLSLNATHSQNSISKRVDISFPSLTYNVNRFFPFRRKNAVKQNVFDKIGVNYLLEARNTFSGKDTVGIFGGNILDSLKYGIKHSLPISTNFNLFKYITLTPALNLSSVMYTKAIRKDFITDPVLYPGGRVVTSNVNDFAVGYDANFSTSLTSKVFFDYFFKRGKIKQIRHLMIPTLAYTYRPDFGDAQFGIWKKVQTDTLGHTTKYSIFERSLFGGPAQGKQNTLSINLSNNVEAKIRKKTDTGFVYNKAVLIQNLSVLTSYNFAADSFRMADIGLSARTKILKYFDIVASSAFDPYAVTFDPDKNTYRRLKDFAYAYNGKLARFKTANFTVTTNLSSNMIEALKKARKPSVTNGVEQGAVNDLIKNVKVPWNINLSYGLTLTSNNRIILPTQFLNVSGDIMPTKYWKIGVTTGFDFVYQKLSYTSINLHRDLKCWEARIDWVPFGVNKRYSLTINIKSAMLRDFKIPAKQHQWFDNF